MKYFKILLLIIASTLNSSCSETKSKKEASTEAQTLNKTTEQSGFLQQKITESLYVLKSPNYNTNIGVFIGDVHVLLIDPMSGVNNQQQLLTAIKALSDKPIKYVINTHHHMDHSGANDFFKDLGATIISHENAKYSNAKYDVTFKDTYALDMGNEKIELHHTIAHTFDDILVYFKSNNAVFMGDTYMTNSFPHFYYGGGSSGHSNIIDKALSLGNNNTVIIPAHGKLSSNKTELATYKEHSVKWINRIKQLHSEGKTSSQIANDETIKELSLIFNDGRNVTQQSIQQTIDKTIAVDLVSRVSMTVDQLKSFEGSYTYSDGQVDEIIYQSQKLIFRSKGNYIYEIMPLSGTKFHVKGQFPNKHLTFSDNNQQVTFFNGKEDIIATKNSNSQD